MTTIIEKDSPTSTLALIFAVILLLGGGAAGLAYMNGAFAGKTTVIENKTIENKTVILPAPAAPAEEPHDKPVAPEPAR